METICNGQADLGRMEWYDDLFATGPENGIYHIVVRNKSETLCGLKVSRLRSDHLLHIVSDESAQYVICKHCERIKQADSVHGQ